MNKRIVISLAVLGVAVLSIIISFAKLYVPAYSEPENTYIYLYDADTPSDVKEKLSDAGVSTFGFNVLRMVGYHVRSGRYEIQNGENIVTIFRRLRNGMQTPVNLVIPCVRTMPRMAGFLSHALMLDSVQVAESFADSAFCAAYGHTPQTLPALFVPNTYQVYWNVSLPDFMKRMQREHDAFWTAERKEKAKLLNLTEEEVATVASIVDEETSNNAEKSMIAGLYLNRLQRGMLLQADPTVKYAVGDFGLRRIVGKHLAVDSPYNTYIYKGLPPGPIRVASVAGLDAVLNRAQHNYLYMCAKEDFSGTHNFAVTFAEHQQNARRYVKALNARNIH